MSRTLEGKRCLVTGGSRNLGRAIALAFARAGARMAFTFHKSQDDAASTEAELRALGAEPLVFQGDVVDPAHASATVKAIVARWGGLDVLVNAAGVTQVLPVALLEEADWDLVMDVNVKGTYLFSRAALKPMLKARSGHILNLGYFASERIIDVPVHYAASKAAVRGFTEALAREVGRYGVAVNCLAPGLTDVGLSKRVPKNILDDYSAHAALGRLGTADEIARHAVWLVSDDNALVRGAKLTVDGGV